MPQRSVSREAAGLTSRLLLGAAPRQLPPDLRRESRSAHHGDPRNPVLDAGLDAEKNEPLLHRSNWVTDHHGGRRILMSRRTTCIRLDLVLRR